MRDRLRLGQGWSAALDDSRAFSYDPDRRQATFAFTGYDQRRQRLEKSSALGITVSNDGHLSLAGQLDLAGGAWSQRVLIDGDQVFAVADDGIVAGDADTMTRTGELDFTTG